MPKFKPPVSSTRTHTDADGVIRPLTALHTDALAQMRQTAEVKSLTLVSYRTADQLLLSEALDILRDLAWPTRGKRTTGTIAREAFSLLCMHGLVFTDGTLVWLL